MFRFGYWELIVLLAVLFILYGHHLPRLMRSLGHGVVELRHDPNTQRPTALVDWLVILMLVGLLLLMLLWPALVRT